MAEVFNVAEIAALEGDASALHLGVFFKVMTQPSHINLWLGVGDIRPGVNVVDTVGETYLGAGKIVNIQSFQQVINGSAENATFVLPAVTQDLLDIAELRANELQNVACWFGYNIMGQDWQPLGPVHWLWTMRGDVVTTDQKPSDGLSGPIIRTISFSMRDEMSARRRARYSYWTDPDQQARYPGDYFCQRGISYASGIYKRWPPT